MTITLPLRRMTLHLSQIFLTLGLTFIVYSLCIAVVVLPGCRGPLLSNDQLLVAAWLLVPVNDPPTTEVVRA